MSSADDLAAQLLKTRALYDAILPRRQRWDDLQIAPQAKADYDALIAAETSALAALQKELLALQKRDNTKQLPNPRPDKTDWGIEVPVIKPPVTDPNPPVNLSTKPFDQPAAAALDTRELRRQFQNLANRWAFVWQLGENQQKINRIASDLERPLGEAIILLRWEVFEQPIGSESQPAQLQRISAWHAALAEYQPQLEGEIETLETKYRRDLGVWERWLDRQTGAEGQASWEQFIAGTKQSLRQKMAETQAKISTDGKKPLEATKP